MKPLLVGELNPLGIDQKFALYPLPAHSAGHNLCTKVMGLNRGAYLRAFDRANLCAGRWSMKEARDNADELCRTRRGTGNEVPVFVLLGARVCDAFAVEFAPFTIDRRFSYLGVLVEIFVVLPHPSGRSRLWNEDGAYDRARAALAEAGALPARSRTTAEAIERAEHDVRYGCGSLGHAPDCPDRVVDEES